VTVKVYEVPFVNPETVIGDEPVPVNPPGLDVAVNVLTAEPPVAFAENATDACASPPVTDVILGACGTVVAVTPDEADEAADVPYGLVAETVYVYCVLEARLVTVIGEEEPVNVEGEVVGVGVTMKLVGAPPLVGAVNATVILPLL
jgi:hypothetical protein